MGLSKYLILSLVGFICGIFISSYFDFNWLIYIGTLVLLVAVIIIFQREWQVLILGVFAISIILGLFYANIYKTYFIKNTVANYNNQKVTLEGYICRPQDVKPEKTNLTLEVEKIRRGEKILNVSGRVLIYAKKYPSFEYGDYLRISGILREPPIFPDFNYKNYLARFQIHSVIFQEEIGEVNQEPDLGFLGKSWLSIQKSLFNIKDNFEKKIGQILPEPQGAFLDGLLLGVKKFIPEDLLNNFNTTGTTHILVISGFNITIIIKTFMALTRRWSRRLAYLLAILGIITFVIMTGADAPVVRAGIMGVIIMWAEREGRKSDATIALLVAAVIMILINPLVLRFDVGFQLSFLATAGLIFLSEPLKKGLQKNRFTKKLPEIITEAGTATIAAQVFVLPIILFNFGRLSLIAPVANILILPIIPLTMFVGFCAVILGFLWIGLGQLIGLLAWVLLSYMILVVEKLALIPGSSFEVGKFSWIWILVYYYVLAGFVMFLNLRQKKLAEED